MRVLKIVEKRLNPEEQANAMSVAVKKLGKGIVETLEVWDDPSEEIFTNTLFRIEHNGPESEPVPDFFADNTDAEIVLTSFCPISSKGMDVLESARVIGSIRGGFQHINVREATKRGIAVYNAPGRNADSVSDFTVGLMICECRSIARNHHLMMSGIWKGPDEIIRYEPDLFGKTLGLIGVGHVGMKVAKKVSGFDMKVIGYDPYADPAEIERMGITLVDLDVLVSESDFISVHARVTDDNYHMIGKKQFEMMKPTAFFINTARAPLVDTEALINTLREKRISGAALDVYDNEPLSQDSPLLTLDNVTLTAHLAGVSSDVVTASPRILISEIIDTLKEGSTRGLVNPDVLENAVFKQWLEKVRKDFYL